MVSVYVCVCVYNVSAIYLLAAPKEDLRELLFYFVSFFLYGHKRSFEVLTEAEDIKKRWQEYTEELYKKDLDDPDNHDGGVITHLEPDILECKVK